MPFDIDFIVVIGHSPRGEELGLIVHVLSLIVLAFAVSLDGFGVGVTYGLRKIRIPFLSVFIIACCSGFIIWLSMQAGGYLSGFLSDTVAKLIGAVILILIGCWALVQLGRSKSGDEPDDAHSSGLHSPDGCNSAESQQQPPVSVPMQVLKVELKRLGLVIQILRKPQAADVDRSGIISASEAVMLGVALSLDAFGAGLGAALLGLPAITTAIIIAASGAIFLVGGTRVGLRMSAKRGIHALSYLPGILLIMMGIMKLL